MAKASSRAMRRLCIFSFYDAHGIIDDYVFYFLEKLSKHTDRILFYSNGPIHPDFRPRIEKIVSEVHERPNEGFDVMAYRDGLFRIDFDRDQQFDEVLMINDTCYGPLYPFSELFDEMDKRKCDFWGITAHLEMTPNPLTGNGVLPYHINANFIAVRARLLRSQEFRDYWTSLTPAAHYIQAILSHEAFFTKRFTDFGYKADTYLDCFKYGTHYPLVLDVDETIIDRNPIIKRRNFFHDPRFFEANATDLPRAIRIIEETSDYDLSMIWRNAVRRAQLRQITMNAGLTSVIPDVREKKGKRNYGNVAICAHVYYVEMLDELLEHADTIPVPYDFIATTETEEKKAAVEAKLRGQNKIRNVIVRVVEQNRGRDMSSLFITCRDLFLDDRYDLVCRLHTKKSPQVHPGRGNLFKRHMLENLLNSDGFTANVLDMFYDKPWIGVAVPPVVQISYGTMGHAWYANKPKTQEVAQKLGVTVDMDPYTPIAAYGTMFWFRPKALRRLFAYPWKWEDFNKEPHHVDGGLAHALERIICYVAQQDGYTTQQIISSHLAGWNYSVLEYKLQRLSAAFVNADFNHQCYILEQRVAAGVPIIDTITIPEPPKPAHDQAHTVYMPVRDQPPTVKQAWGYFSLAAKRSLAFRAPYLYRVLRPIYRSFSKR